MPWQQQVADVGLEVDENGEPYYREVICTVPRQNGKTTLVLAWEIQRATGWDEPQRIAYTAQTGKDAREKIMGDQAPLLDPAVPPKLPIKALIRRVMRGIGNEAVEFKNGSRIFLLASGADAGHGKVIDLGVQDETFADEDDRREQAMLPAMLTRPAAQILNISTAGTEKSTYLRRKVDAGRDAVTAGKTSGVAYFEWSAPDDADIDDHDTWYGCMPALGHTIDLAVVEHARATMSEGEFRRAMLNQWTVSEERVIPRAAWDEACSADVKPAGQLVFAVDVNPDRSAAAIACADETGRVELVAHSEGVGWVVPELIRLTKRWDCDVALDGYGPAGNLIEELEAAEVTVHVYDTREMSRACADFYDAVADGRCQIRRNAALEAAAAAATRRQTGDTWLWARRNTGDDVSPLIAATIAFDKAAEHGGDVFFSLG